MAPKRRVRRKAIWQPAPPRDSLPAVYRDLTIAIEAMRPTVKSGSRTGSPLYQGQVQQATPGISTEDAVREFCEPLAHRLQALIRRGDKQSPLHSARSDDETSVAGSLAEAWSMPDLASFPNTTDSEQPNEQPPARSVTVPTALPTQDIDPRVRRFNEAFARFARAEKMLDEHPAERAYWMGFEGKDYPGLVFRDTLRTPYSDGVACSKLSVLQTVGHPKGSGIKQSLLREVRARSWYMCSRGVAAKARAQAWATRAEAEPYPWPVGVYIPPGSPLLRDTNEERFNTFALLQDGCCEEVILRPGHMPREVTMRGLILLKFRRRKQSLPPPKPQVAEKEARKNRVSSARTSHRHSVAARRWLAAEGITAEDEEALLANPDDAVSDEYAVVEGIVKALGDKRPGFVQYRVAVQDRLSRHYKSINPGVKPHVLRKLVNRGLHMLPRALDEYTEELHAQARDPRLQEAEQKLNELAAGKVSGLSLAEAWKASESVGDFVRRKVWLMRSSKVRTGQ